MIHVYVKDRGTREQENSPEPPGNGQVWQILTFTAVRSAKQVCPSSAMMVSCGRDGPSPCVSVNELDRMKEAAEICPRLANSSHTQTISSPLT